MKVRKTAANREGLKSYDSFSQKVIVVHITSL